MNIPRGWQRRGSLYLTNGGCIARWGKWRWRAWGTGGFLGLFWTLRSAANTVAERAGRRG